MRLRHAIVACLAVVSAARAQAPTFDDVFIGDVSLDAGGTRPLYTDIYVPSGATSPTPLVVFVHGGSWRTGDHNGVPPPILELLSSGIAIATSGHRSSTEAIYPAQLFDLKGLVRYLRGKAIDYNIDPARIAVWGVSSGGHLGLLLATTHGVAELEGDVGGNLSYSSRVAAAVDYFGPTDLLYMGADVLTPPGTLFDHDAQDSANSELIGFNGPGEGMGVLRANEQNPLPPYPEKVALAQSANPITFLTPDDPPIFLTHGEQDVFVPHLQSSRLFDAAIAAGMGTVFRSDPLAGHGSMHASAYAQSRAFLVRVLFDGPQSEGVPYCFGDGTGTACPCSNASPAGKFVGCRTSTTDGGRLRATGSASTNVDTLALKCTDVTGTLATFHGSTAMEANGQGTPFGQGLRCIEGAAIRLGTRAVVNGVVQYPANGDTPVTLQGGLLPGTTYYFQVTFRDSPAACSAASLNTTNGLAITTTP